MAHLPENVRFLPEKDYWTTGEDKPLLLGSFPCMVCAIHDMDEELQGLHLTYLQASYDKPCGEGGLHAPRYQKLAIKHPETGEALSAKKMRSRKKGSISGQAVHLFPIPENGRLVIAEGIETALAARELFNAHDWGLYAALSANSMANFQFLKPNSLYHYRPRRLARRQLHYAQRGNHHSDRQRPRHYLQRRHQPSKGISAERRAYRLATKHSPIRSRK